MYETLSASIIAIGSEITSGKIQDSHGKYLSTELDRMGIVVRSISLIPDNENVCQYIDSEKDKSDIVIITGGLGPTSDDITRDLVASIAGVDLVFHKSILEKLNKKYPGRHNSSREKQAYIPSGFTILENFCGTAPGFYGYIGNSLIFSLPGPPSEMREMFTRSVKPVIEKKYGLSVIEFLNISCFLMCESGLEDMCLQYGSSDILWGTMVQPYKIGLYLYGGNGESRLRFFYYLQEKFGKELVVLGDIKAEEILSEALKAQDRVLCTAESMTGGLISKLITDLPGSSGLFWGAFISYSNEAKKNLLDITEKTLREYGAVSREVVLEMAERSLFLSGANLSIAVSGYADDSGEGNIAAGTVWIAVKSGEGVHAACKFKFRGKRDLVRRKSAVAAMLFAEIALRVPERLDSCCKWQYS